jgi:hypothetical protein
LFKKRSALLLSRSDILAATHHGRDLAQTPKQIDTFVRNHKNSLFYLYQLENAKVSEIEWIDSVLHNQRLFSKPSFKDETGKKDITLFRFPAPV